MRADYHIHLHHSPCTADEMTVDAVVAEAGRCGLEEIGLIDHLHPNTESAIFRQARSEITGLGGEFSGRILLGAELDLLDQDGNTTFRPDVAEAVDFLSLGMGHYQLGWVTADLTQPPDRFLEREAESLIRALERHRVSVVVHPFIYVAFPKLAPHYVGALWPDRLPPALIDTLADVLIARNTAMEFHCRDLIHIPQRLGGEPFVTSYMALLDVLREKGVHFVSGSDAHRLNQIHRSAEAPDWARNRLPI
ncbi:hypothetical protein [Roseomonas genomospecies 6]|uniref:hypothetical protein n=1 Tax=Roseomonas genomospecies 6 TaxID=214106 RepID=UPI00142F013B|nr:hypothetical protein [Roseomonas genomospecies 6]